MNTKALAASILLLTAAARPQGTVTVTSDSLNSAATAGVRRYHVVLPPGYEKSPDRYPVLYLLHGLGGNRADWVEKSKLTTYARSFRLIIVTPDAGDSWYTNAPGDSSARYEDYLLKELIPAVEGRYRALATRHGRLIAGLSMGGNGAVRFALKYPSRFIAAGAFSGAFQVPRMEKHQTGTLRATAMKAFGSVDGPFWTANDVFRLLDSAKAGSLPFIYLTVGRSDNLPGLLAANRVLAAQLQQKKAAYEYHEVEGGHDWRTWDRALREFLRTVTPMLEENPG